MVICQTLMLRAGERVCVYWAAEKASFDGRVTNVSDDVFTVKYDDGDIGWAEFAASGRIEAIKKPPPSSGGGTAKKATPKKTEEAPASKKAEAAKASPAKKAAVFGRRQGDMLGHLPSSVDCRPL